MTRHRASYVHARRTSSDLPAFLETVQLSSAIGVCLALHVVVIVGPTAVANKEGCAHQGGRGSTDLWHLGNAFGHRCCVDEDMLIEPV